MIIGRAVDIVVVSWGLTLFLVNPGGVVYIDFESEQQRFYRFQCGRLTRYFKGPKACNLPFFHLIL